ncbi:MAG: hypothetical protein M3306_04200 [Actinomycetota bacterium]|nr:hypothetical protein [Actinomycetota bacterium]
MSPQLGEIAHPTIADRVQAFMNPLQRPADNLDPDTRRSTVETADFEDAVLILEAVVDALRARVDNNMPAVSAEIAGTADQIQAVADDLTAAGGDVDRESYGVGEEWKRDLRYALAKGADSYYQGK